MARSADERPGRGAETGAPSPGTVMWEIGLAVLVPLLAAVAARLLIAT